MENLEEIVKRIKNDDEEAFEELYRETVRYLYAIIYPCLLSKEDTEDVIQNTYMKVYSVRKRIKSEKYILAYMKRIAISYAMRTLKKRKRFNANIADSNENYEIKELINLSLEKLDPQDRLIVTLFYMEDSSIKEISFLTGIPANTVKTRLFRARMKLREVIKNELI